MKGDFSRQTFDPRKHYGGVLMQQGRVQVDADWNEQEAIVRRRTQVEARDVIGACGGPRGAAGFGISLSNGSLQIGAGRYYVDGLLVENETDALAYEAQPDLPGPPDWAKALGDAKATLGLAYLDVFERHVTPLDDPLIREVALGGPDTATRVQTVWQVRVMPLSGTGDPARLEELQAKRADVARALDAATRQNDAARIAELRKVLAEIDAEIAKLRGTPTCDADLPEWDALLADPDRHLNARTVPPPPVDGPCIVPPTAGYRRLENQLYRVEVHAPGAIGTATFKWSRDNGTVVTAIERIAGKELTVHDLGPDDVLGFAGGQWVEISDDALELAGQPGRLAQIEAVDPSLRTITLTAAPSTLSGDPSGVDPARRPKLRRWDQSGDAATATGVVTATGWTALEDGVEVAFDGGPFATGDYWLIPARTATGEIEWPPFAVPNTAPEPQSRLGIVHHFCRLALLRFDSANNAWLVDEDCRSIFDPLVDSCCNDRNALHVDGTNWQNDDFFPLSALQQDGLRITLDGPPDPGSLTDDSLQVLMEAPFPTGQPTTGFSQRVYVHGTILPDPNDPNTIVWRAQTAETSGGTVGGTTTGPAPGGATTGGGAPSGGAGGATPGGPGGGVSPGGIVTGPIGVAGGGFTPLSGVHINAVRLSELLGTSPTVATGTPPSDAAAQPAIAEAGLAEASIVVRRTIRLRVLLKGGWVWSAQAGSSGDRIHVDGQTFGQPGTRDDGTPRIDLRFPSGNGAQASDFESWFIAGAAPNQAPLRVTTVAFAAADGRASSAGDVAIPLTRDVVFKAGEEISQVTVTFSRPILDTSLGDGETANVYVERDDGGQRSRLTVALRLLGPNVAQLILRDPTVFGPGNYVLTCKGTDANGAAGGIAAADDNSALDGNFDGQAGGDFTMSFNAA